MLTWSLRRRLAAVRRLPPFYSGWATFRTSPWTATLPSTDSRAMDFDDAFAVACEAGHGMEETYVNGDGEGVRWAFERVMTLDMLPEELASGTEVYSEPHEVESSPEIAFDSVLTPELHPPEQSGVPST